MIPEELEEFGGIFRSVLQDSHLIHPDVAMAII